jgi:hypothetical protein
MTTNASKAARLLGRKGGKARAKTTTPEQRREWSQRGGQAARDASTPEERSARGKAAAAARWAKAKRDASVDSKK